MTTEQQAAAERLRRAASPSAIKHMSDYRLLADAYLAEHPADDDEPITEEWLRGVGFSRDDERPFWWINDGGMPRAGGFDLCFWDDGDCTAEDADNSIIFKRPQTRGHLRRLLSALGISTKETP